MWVGFVSMLWKESDMHHLDQAILLFINGHHAPWLDTIMWYVSQPLIWVPLYLAIIVLLWKAYDKKWVTTLIGVAVIVAAFGLSDFISSGLIKAWVQRPRPSHSELAPLLHSVRDYHGGPFGFPSSHAADTMAVAVSSLLLLRSRNAALWMIMALYVVLNCYSRIYLGVHYPSDILVGALIGACLAYLCYIFAKKFAQSKYLL